MPAPSRLAVILCICLTLALWELWFWALAALVWCYFTWIGYLDETVLPRTQAGVGLLATGALILVLFGEDDALYSVGAILAVVGWIMVAAEPGLSA